MERVSIGGVVHFNGCNNTTLCGVNYAKMLKQLTLFTVTPNVNAKKSHFVTAPVNCPCCATLYCKIKNSPWNEVEDAAMDRGIYDAVRENHE